MPKNANLAYVIGVAIGDGNLSNPNGRAVRLRITCDKKYPNLRDRILKSIKKARPDNKVSIVNRKDNCVDISCYSNEWEKILGWSHCLGPKHTQEIQAPSWIKEKEAYKRSYLKGLFETDGSIYLDRGYIMVNFVTIIPKLAKEVCGLIKELGFLPTLQIKQYPDGRRPRYTVRVSKNSSNFIKFINIQKD